MGLVLGVAALFFGVAFVIVGYKGGDPNTLTTNLVGMMEGKWITGTQGGTPTVNVPSRGATSTTGGVHSPGTKPGTNP
jgi:hypothetical protein